MSKYTCTDCGHSYAIHNSVIVPWGCTAVDATSIDCVNGYQGERPPSEPRARSERQLLLDELLLTKCGATFNRGSAMYGGPGAQTCTLNRGHIGSHHVWVDPVPVTVERLREVVLRG